jgi:hypothetical protein
MLKIYEVSFNDGGWHSGVRPSYQVVAENEEDAKKVALEKYQSYKVGYDVSVSEFSIDGYVIEVYDEKTYNREKNLEKLDIK